LHPPLITLRRTTTRNLSSPDPSRRTRRARVPLCNNSRSSNHHLLHTSRVIIPRPKGLILHTEVQVDKVLLKSSNMPRETKNTSSIWPLLLTIEKGQLKWTLSEAEWWWWILITSHSSSNNSCTTIISRLLLPLCLFSRKALKSRLNGCHPNKQT
jgi:hypothetical protein